MSPCEICDGEGWVCIDHPDLIWDSWHQLMCEGGKPCVCNIAHENNLSKEERQKLNEYDEQEILLRGFKK